MSHFEYKSEYYLLLLNNRYDRKSAQCCLFVCLILGLGQKGLFLNQSQHHPSKCDDQKCVSHFEYKSEYYLLLLNNRYDRKSAQYLMFVCCLIWIWGPKVPLACPQRDLCQNQSQHFKSKCDDQKCVSYFKYKSELVLFFSILVLTENLLNVTPAYM